MYKGRDIHGSTNMHVSLWALFHQIRNVNVYPLLPSSLLLLFHQVHIVLMYRALKMPFQVVFPNKHKVAIVKWAGYWSLGAFASVIKSSDLIKNRPFGFTTTLGWSTYPLWLFQSVPVFPPHSLLSIHLPDETFHDCHVLTCKGILCHILQNCTCTEYCAHATREYGFSCLHSKRSLWVQTIDQPTHCLPMKMFDRNQAMHKERDLVWCVYV